MNKVQYWLIALAVASYNLSFSQNSYIKMDSAIIVGVKLLDEKKNNAKYISRNYKGKLIKYTPYNIQEFGLENGQIYRSLKIGGMDSLYFFEQLSSGLYNVYYLPKKISSTVFYITKNDSIPLTRLPKLRKEYMPFLREYVKNCPRALENVKHVRMTKSSMGRFFNDFENCANSHLPTVRFGLHMGINLVRFFPSAEDKLLSAVDFSNLSGYHVGLMVDFPIGKSNYSFSTAMTLYGYKGSTVFDQGEVTYDLVANQWRIAIPLLLRHTFYSMKTSPFIEGGSVLSGKVMDRTSLYSYHVNGDNIFINLNDTPIQDYQAGVSIGAGLISKYSSNLSLQFSFKYNKLFSLQKQRESLNVNQMFFSMGILF